jgi:DNA-directed RNA polymerase alpha subunit
MKLSDEVKLYIDGRIRRRVHEYEMYICREVNNEVLRDKLVRRLYDNFGIEKYNNYLSNGVSDFLLSVRARRCLDSAGIYSVGDLAKLSDDQLLRIKNLGRTTLSELKRQILMVDDVDIRHRED